MKLLPILVVVALYCHAIGAELTTTENTALAQEHQALRDAATTFCTELRQERIEGLPSAEQLKRLSPLITPELLPMFEYARAYQKEQLRRHPEEKPEWIEGDFFSSTYEGVSSWEIDEVFSAPSADGTVKVKQSYTEPGQQPIIWADTLVFKPHAKRWLLDDIRKGGEWAFKSNDSLRGLLPGGGLEEQDHDSLDGRWHITFTRDGREVSQITIEPTDKSTKPVTLYGGNGETCPFFARVLWSPGCDMLAIHLGESPRFTRIAIYRYADGQWQPVTMPDFYPEEKKTMVANGFRERHSIITAEHWQDANTLVVKYFGNFTKGDEGDGFYKYMSVRIDPKGNATVVGAVDTPEGY